VDSVFFVKHTAFLDGHSRECGCRLCMIRLGLNLSIQFAAVLEGNRSLGLIQFRASEIIHYLLKFWINKMFLISFFVQFLLLFISVIYLVKLTSVLKFEFTTMHLCEL
jgi:hypothetical protein